MIMQMQAVIAEPKRRKELQNSLDLVVTEMICIGHVHHVSNPQHYNFQESWVFGRSSSSAPQKKYAIAKAGVSQFPSGILLSADML